MEHWLHGVDGSLSSSAVPAEQNAQAFDPSAEDCPTPQTSHTAALLPPSATGDRSDPLHTHCKHQCVRSRRKSQPDSRHMMYRADCHRPWTPRCSSCTQRQLRQRTGLRDTSDTARREPPLQQSQPRTPRKVSTRLCRHRWFQMRIEHTGRRLPYHLPCTRPGYTPCMVSHRHSRHPESLMCKSECRRSCLRTVLSSFGRHRTGRWRCMECRPLIQ